MANALTKIAIAAGAGAAVAAPVWVGYKLIMRASQLVLLPLVGVGIWVAMSYVPPALVQQKLSAPPAFSVEEKDKAVAEAVAKAMADSAARQEMVRAAMERGAAEERARAAEIDKATEAERAKRPKVIERRVEVRVPVPVERVIERVVEHRVEVQSAPAVVASGPAPVVVADAVKSSPKSPFLGPNWTKDCLKINGC